MNRVLPDDRQNGIIWPHPAILIRKAIKTPAVALSNALLETVRMTELLERMFDKALEALRTGSIEKLKVLKDLDERINVYQTQVQSYLADLAQEQLTPEESRRALELVLYISNLEHAGDVIQLNLADRIESKARESISFTLEERPPSTISASSSTRTCGWPPACSRRATSRVPSGSSRRRMPFRELQNEVLDSHFKLGSRAKGGALRRSALYVDMIRDLNRINALVVSAGYPIADAAGLLRGSRLRKDTAAPT
jgi:phosphate:Na+ symporter